MNPRESALTSLLQTAAVVGRGGGAGPGAGEAGRGEGRSPTAGLICLRLHSRVGVRVKGNASVCLAHTGDFHDSSGHYNSGCATAG